MLDSSAELVRVEQRECSSRTFGVHDSTPTCSTRRRWWRSSRPVVGSSRARELDEAEHDSRTEFALWARSYL